MLQLEKLSQERLRRPITTERLMTLQTRHIAPKKGKDPARPEHAYRQTRTKHHTLDENSIKKACPLDNGKHKDRNGAKEIQLDDAASLQIKKKPHAQLEQLVASVQLYDCFSSQVPDTTCEAYMIAATTKDHIVEMELDDRQQITGPRLLLSKATRTESQVTLILSCTLLWLRS
jgi:predicted Zn-dependent protease